MSKHVPAKPSGSHVVTVRMPAAVIGKLSREARERGVAVSYLIREAIAAHWREEAAKPAVTWTPNPSNSYWPASVCPFCGHQSYGGVNFCGGEQYSAGAYTGWGCPGCGEWVGIGQIHGCYGIAGSQQPQESR